MALHPASSRLHHSICINLNQLQHRGSNEKLPTVAGTHGAKPKGPKHHTSSDRPKKEKRLCTKKEGGKENRWISVVGEKAEVLLEENRVEKMAESKKEAGKKLREAEAEITETVEKVREPPPKELRKVAPPTTIHGAPRLSKDALAFSRAFESMTLSTFKAVEKIHEVERMKENWDRKATHVARMKTERERQRKKIQDFQQKTRDTIETWKIMEEDKLTRLRDKAAEETVQSILDRALRRTLSDKDRQQEATQRSFATEFVKKSLSVGRDVSKDDREASLEERREEIKKQVKKATEAARQRRQEVQAEREIRETQLVWEGALAKKELSGKMMQAAAQRMSEAKSRVGRAVNRREAAKASIEKAREALRLNANRDHLDKLPPLQLDLRTEAELAKAARDTLQEFTAAESTPAPFRLRCFTHEASRTWQRGTRVLAEREKGSHPQAAPTSVFPDIDGTSPTYHHQLRPGRILQNLGPTPVHSELTEPTPVAETPPDDHCDCEMAHPCFAGVT